MTNKTTDQKPKINRRNLPKLCLVNYPVDNGFIVRSFEGFADQLARHHKGYKAYAPLDAKLSWAISVIEREPELIGETFYSVATLGTEEINPELKWFADAVKTAMTRCNKTKRGN